MASNTEMKNPKTGDVKVVPDELVEQFTGRGWEKTKASSKSTGSSSSTKKRTAAKRTAAKPADTGSTE